MKDFDEELEKSVRDHLLKQFKLYKSASDKGSKTLLEYKLSNGNAAIDRDLLGDYLSLKAARENNTVQRWVAFFAGLSVAAALISIALAILGTSW